jgi:drug/metabolite transporter (DMT)-like permease
MRWLPLGLVVLGNLAYHLGQKRVPAGAHALVATLAMYVVAAATSLLLMPLVAPLPTRAASASALHWSVALVGVGIVGIEVGFLLAYRQGWEISSAALTATSVLALLLLPIGVLAFREAWSLSRLLGFALCVAGLWLVHRS